MCQTTIRWKDVNLSLTSRESAGAVVDRRPQQPPIELMCAVSWFMVPPLKGVADCRRLLHVCSRYVMFVCLCKLIQPQLRWKPLHIHLLTSWMLQSRQRCVGGAGGANNFPVHLHTSRMLLLRR
jgi:hypothetical protein